MGNAKTVGTSKVSKPVIESLQANQNPATSIPTLVNASANANASVNAKTAKADDDAKVELVTAGVDATASQGRTATVGARVGAHTAHTALVPKRLVSTKTPDKRRKTPQKFNLKSPDAKSARSSSSSSSSATKPPLHASLHTPLHQNQTPQKLHQNLSHSHRRNKSGSKTDKDRTEKTEIPDLKECLDTSTEDVERFNLRFNKQMEHMKQIVHRHSLSGMHTNEQTNKRT